MYYYYSFLFCIDLEVQCVCNIWSKSQDAEKKLWISKNPLLTSTKIMQPCSAALARSEDAWRWPQPPPHLARSFFIWIMLWLGTDGVCHVRPALNRRMKWQWGEHGGADYVQGALREGCCSQADMKSGLHSRHSTVDRRLLRAGSIIIFSKGTAILKEGKR